MGYKAVAVHAAQVARDYKVSPVKTWKFFVENEFPESMHSRDKGCPKSTFLGLCEEGVVAGVPAGSYTNSKDNKRYGLNAVEILKAHPTGKFTSSELWAQVLKLEEDQNKRPNSQMDVVLGLWDANLIKDK